MSGRAEGILALPPVAVARPNSVCVEGFLDDPFCPGVEFGRSAPCWWPARSRNTRQMQALTATGRASAIPADELREMAGRQAQEARPAANESETPAQAANARGSIPSAPTPPTIAARPPLQELDPAEKASPLLIVLPASEFLLLSSDDLYSRHGIDRQQATSRSNA